MLRTILRIVGYSLLVLLAVVVNMIIVYIPGDSQTEVVEKLSFEFKRNVIVLKADLNGEGPFNFILDTGTDPSVLDRELSQQISLYQFQLGPQDVGENQPIEIDIPLPVNLRVGNLPEARKLFLALDIGKISEKMGMKIHGIIGYNFLKDNIFQINYLEKTLTFYPSDQPPYDDSNQSVLSLPLEFIDDGTFPLIENAEINNKPIRVSIDTGFNGPLTLYGEAIALLDLNMSIGDLPTVNTEGYGGSNEAVITELTSFSIRGWQFRTDSVLLDFGSAKSKVPLEVRGGNMGNGAFKDYILTLDYAKQRIWFER